MSRAKLLAIAIVLVIIGSATGYVLISNASSGDDRGFPNEEYPGSVTITQNDGKQITVATPVDKVCVVNSNAAEFMQVLNVTDRVVGVSESIAEDTEFGYIYDNVPTIGTYSTPNGENILALDCHVVIGQCTAMTIKDTAVLEDMGITVILLDCYGLDQMTDDLRQLAGLFGYDAKERAESYIDLYTGAIAAVAQAGAVLGTDVTAYMELSNGKAYTSKAEMSSLIDLARGYNIMNDLVKSPTSSTQQVSNEAVIAYDEGNGPDYILFRKGGITDNATAEQEYQNLVSREGWSNLEAVKNDHVFIITQSGIMSGPRIFIGLAYLFEMFHPGVLDMTAADLLGEYNHAFGYAIDPMMGYHHLSA
jgi:iron complex transport system substrate-binding protein